MGESIDSISLRARNEQLEADSITFRNGVVDGGLSAISRRAKFKILIFNTNRIAIHIAGALKAAGFEELIIIDRSPRNHRSRYVQGEDLNGGYFRKSEILHLKEPLIDELCSPGLSGERRKIDLPDLIIAAGSPNFDAQQRWMSEATPHFIVEYENSAEVRIGPLVIPGKTPCLECIEVSEVESGNNLPAREQFKEYELSSGLALQTAGLVTLAVCEFADTGSSQFLERTMALSGHDFLRPTMRTWLMHPSCGCAC